MKNLTLYIDIAFCVIVLPMMALLFPVERWFHYFQWYVVSVGVWFYAVYFTNRLVAVPALFKGGSARWWSIAFIALSIIVTYMLSDVQLYSPKPNHLDNGIVRLFPSVTHHQGAVLALFVIVETYSFAVGLLTEANRQRSRRRKLEAEREAAEIELYKAQIKPHFMFNTLNSIYGLFLTRNSRALESLEKFISMMRYIHTSSNRTAVPLSDEANYIKEFVDLQTLRVNEMTSVNLTVDISDPQLMVPPMLLITFVENCFKHGVSPVEKSDIIIYLKESNGKLVFTTSNKTFPVKRIGEHMGINNCRKRLKLLYPGRHHLSINSADGFYNVKLSINLKQS